MHAHWQTSVGDLVSLYPNLKAYSVLEKSCKNIGTLYDATATDFKVFNSFNNTNNACIKWKENFLTDKSLKMVVNLDISR